MGESQAAVTFPEAEVVVGPSWASPSGGTQGFGCMKPGQGLELGLWGGKRNPQQVGTGYIMSVYDDLVLIVC